MSPVVTTVVVVHDSADLLEGCLQDVARAGTGTDADVVVVDSGSTDDPRAICDALGVRFVEGPNAGLGAAFNRALDLDGVRNARYVLQLNPDVRMPPGALAALVAEADRLPRCGILGPRQVDQHGEVICSMGVEPSPADYWRGFARLRCDWVWDADAYERPRTADWVMGACLLLRQSMLEDVGGFDERFFLCSEEVDLCRRARTAGWTVDFTPSVTVEHPIAGRAVDPHRVRLEEWSRILYMRKWRRRGGRAVMRVALVARFARLAVIDARGDRASDAWLRLRATLWFDRSRYGPARPA